MTNGELVLDYVRTLVWPSVVVAGGVLFRAAIAQKIRGLKSLDAGGVKTTFETEAEALDARADKIATQAERTPGTDSSSRHEGTELATPAPVEETPSARAVKVALYRSSLDTLSSARNFDLARRVAITDPNAAVMSAYRQLEQGLRASAMLLGLPRDPSPSTVGSVLDQLNDLDDESRSIFAELRRLRNQVTHSVEDVTPSAALAYLSACERLMEIVAISVLSRLRHPSHQQRTAEMFGQDWTF